MTEELVGIPVEIDLDAAKDVVLETCKTPVSMDVTQMRPNLEKWGFKVEDYEMLTDGDPAVIQEYMVWLECDYGIELARVNVSNWLEGLDDWPWIGLWTFVLKYCGGVPSLPHKEWTFEVYSHRVAWWTLRNVGTAKLRWPRERK